MRMNGNIIHSVNELKRNFVIDELIDVSPQCSSDYLKNSENGKITPSRSE